MQHGLGSNTSCRTLKALIAGENVSCARWRGTAPRFERPGTCPYSPQIPPGYDGDDGWFDRTPRTIDHKNRPRRAPAAQTTSRISTVMPQACFEVPRFNRYSIGDVRAYGTSGLAIQPCVPYGWYYSARTIYATVYTAILPEQDIYTVKTVFKG